MGNRVADTGELLNLRSWVRFSIFSFVISIISLEEGL
jgi:hypothetical protein